MIKRLMWSKIFITFSHLKTMVVDVLDDGIVFVGVDILIDTMLGIAIGSAMDAEVLTDQSANGLAAVMSPFCWTASFCQLTAILDCVRALQACKPSYHVC